MNQPVASSSRRRRRSRVAGRFARLALLLLVAAGLALAYLHVVGLPDAAVRRARVDARRAGVYFDARRFRLDLRHGLVAEDVRFAAGLGETHAVAEARFVVLRFSASAARRGGALLRGFAAHDAALAFESFPPGAEAPVRHEIAAGVRVNGAFVPEGLRLRVAGADTFGLRTEADGLLAGVAAPARRPRGARPPPGPGPRTPPGPAARWTVPPAAVDAVRRAEAILGAAEWAVPPRLVLAFRLDPADVGDASVRLSFEGREGAWRGIALRDVAAVLNGSAEGLRLERLAVDADPLRLEAEGAWMRDNDRIRFRVGGEGPYALWRRLPLPKAAAAALDGLEIEGASHVRFTAAADGASRADPLARLTGRFEVAGAEAYGMPVERAACRYAWTRPRLELREIEGRVGRGRGAGPAAGEADFDFARRRWAVRGRASFDPHFVLPLLYADLARHTAAMRWRDAPPEAEFSIEGTVGDQHTTVLQARVRGADLVYHGSAIDHIETDVSLEAGVLVFERLRARRPEGVVEGIVLQDIPAERVTFDIESRAHPHAVARVIGAEAHRLAQRFRFEGPVHARARGWADTRPDGRMSFAAQVEGERLGMNRFLLERATFDLVGEDRSILVRNLRGVYAGGGVAGEFEMRLPESPRDPIGYAIEGRVAGVDLAELASDLAREDLDAYRGRLDASLRMRGFMGEGQGPNAQGEGRLRVQGDGLLRTPLFGGLSAWLSRLYPGFGFLSQDDLRVPFTIADERFRSEDIRLEGGLVSITGAGEIGFDFGVEGRVQVRLLRRGVVADVLRFFTTPLTRLFEFELGGSLEEPRWRPRNIPFD